MDYVIESAVTEVTVYPDRARVLCRGKCTVDQGRHQVVFGELPLVLEPDSVRAQGAGTARVRLLSVDVNRRMYSVAPSDRVRGLEKALEEQTDALRVVEDNRAGAEAVLAHLDGMRGETEEYARGLARGRSTVDDQVRLLAYLHEEDTAVRQRIRELDTQLREHQREIDKLEAELAQLRSARPLQRYEVRLDIEAMEAGDFEAEISYVVNKAGWQPLYDMRFWQPENGKADEPALRVTYLAEIAQNTGQDWNGARLTVSTARPALNQRMPELQPWYIDEYQPPQPRMVRHNMMAKAALLESAAEDMFQAAAAPAADYAVAEQAVAEVRDEGAVVAFAVSDDVDIPGDGTPQKTVIGQFDLQPEVDYFCAPRHTDAVFRRAKVINDGPGPLLAGQVNLFAGDEFIGSNMLPYTPVNGEVELMLGVEERIVAEREMVRRDVDKRLLRDVRQITYGYEIRLRNGLKSPVQVTVHDQYPNSRHDQIKVKLDSASPQTIEQTQLHILEWQVIVPPATEQKIQFQYSVEHPRDMTIVGLTD